MLIFDFPDSSGAPARLAFAEPRLVIVARTLAGVREAIARAERAARDGAWVAGWVSYEAAPAFDAALAVREGGRMPLVWFGVFDAPGALPDATPLPDAAAPDLWTPDVDAGGFGAAVEEVRRRIAAGEVYQVNYAMRLRAPFRGDARRWYERLRAAQGGGWCAFLETDDWTVCSASPELFFARTGRELVTRPMKGTAPRGRWPAEDAAAATALAASAKERAENVMIVDLLRNDLGRVAETGSVRVPALCAVERYRTVWQLTSTVAATLRTDASLVDVFAALFPCGSVTGAPKVTATRTIAALEHAPREVYCGAIGVIRPGGDCAFNVPIRTVWIDRERAVAEYGVGGGVTWDSTPGGEHAEALAKAAVLGAPAAPPTLLETMRLAADGYARRARHLARLARSAAHHDVAVDVAAVERALDDHAALHAATLATEPRRARLLVTPDGVPAVESQPLGATPPRPRVALARTPVSSADRALFHKTTSRAVYEARRAEWPDAFDVLLHNERGELTEFTIGNVVLELDGARVTPPVGCGLLGGVFREMLLESGAVVERVVGRDDLARATRVWLVNSVREWVEVTLDD